jgi:hypothetical protein
MKKSILISVLVFLLTSVLMGQNSGRGFNFQAVARNSDGSIKSEQTIQLSISIYPSEEKNALLYQENHTVNTDKFGVFSLVIGKGVYEAGSASKFEEIDFSAISAYLNVVLKEGGNDIEIVHAPLLSVPYAEYSTQADNGMPIGAIIPYAGAVSDNSDDITVYGCKGTWRLCNGAEYDPAEFTSLHLVLNDAWGTNRLPDLRGTFIRGTNYSASDSYKDPEASGRVSRFDGNTGNQVGSFQSDAMQNVTGTIGNFNKYAALHGTSTGPFYRTDQSNDTGIGSGNTDPYTRVDFDLSRSTARTSTETRPLNANVNFIIRVK